MRKFLCGAALAAILPFAGLAMAGAALAQSVAQPDYVKGDIAAFHGDMSTLSNAINHVQQMSGGRVLEIRYTNQDNMPGFHIVIAKNGQVDYVRFQENPGKLLELDEHSRPTWMLNWRQKADVHFAEDAKVPLTDAIMTAEQADRAPAIAAGIARSASNPDSDVHAYNVLIDEDGTVRRVSVDDSTGQVIADPQALAGWP